LSTTPIGSNIGNIGQLNNPVYSAIAKDGNEYFVFITNIRDGSLTRLAYGNSLNNTPVAKNLGNLGVMGLGIEGIQIKKDNLTGKWIGLVSWGQVDNLVRLDFGYSLKNIPVAVNLGNIGNLMHYAHTIYTFSESGNWYSFIVNHDPSGIIRLNFGNSLANVPTATNIGNIGGLNGPVGLHPIEENGIWYLFVVNSHSNSITRLDFGNSLLNIPTGINLGDIGGSMNEPRAITILKDCEKIFGFVVNDGSDDIVRLTFPNGLLNTPLGNSLGNVANFSFPHHISELFRVEDFLYAFIMNVDNSTISKIYFPTCNNSSIPSSNLKEPPIFSYSSPGTYNVSLVVNEGLPSQSNICKEILVIGPSIPVVVGDTTLCFGDTLKLTSSAIPVCTYLWTGPNGFSTTNRNLVIPDIKLINEGKYTLTLNGCTVVSIDKFVSILPIPTVIGDTTICVGETLNLIASANIGYSYLWTGPNGYFSINQNLIINNFNANQVGKYILSVGNCGYMVNKFVSISPGPIVDLGNDTIICPGSTLFLDAGNAGMNYKWSTGAVSQIIPVETPGTYSVLVKNGECIGVDEILIDDCSYQLWFPNVFTPNNDGINERFKPICLGVIGSYQILIFNRWGQQLYKSNDAYDGWDGTYNGSKCPDGVYYFVAEYSVGEHSNTINQEVVRGVITILR
jgi:gliding motility-associated-like protein